MKRLLRSVIAAVAIAPVASEPVLAQIAVIDDANLDKRQESESHNKNSDEAKANEKLKKKSVVCTYSNKYRSQMYRRSPSEALKRDAGNVKLIRYYAQKYGVPEGLALSVAYQESRLDSCAGSPTGVKGVMQLTKGTGNGMGFDRDINEQNIEGGVKYLGMGVSKCGASNYSCLSSWYNGSDAAQQKQWAGGVGRWHSYFNNYVSTGAAPAAAPPAVSIVTAGGVGGKAQQAALGTVSNVAANLDASSGRIQGNSSLIDALFGTIGQTTEYKDAWEVNSSARNLNADVTNQYIRQSGDFTALLGQFLQMRNTATSQTAKTITPPKEGSANPFSCDPAELTRLNVERKNWLPCAIENARTAGTNGQSIMRAADPDGAASVIEALQE
jgi:soluble lytic murein transglycosylase-like protein